MGKIFGIYASTTYPKRRELWFALATFQQQHQIPWCNIGDFNTNLIAHEHRGGDIKIHQEFL